MGNVFFYLFHTGTWHTCHGLSKNLVWIDTDCQSRAIIQKTLDATMPPTATGSLSDQPKAKKSMDKLVHQSSHPHQLHQMQQWSQKMTEDQELESWMHMSFISPHPPMSPQSSRHCRTWPSLRSMPRALLLKGWKKLVILWSKNENTGSHAAFRFERWNTSLPKKALANFCMTTPCPWAVEFHILWNINLLFIVKICHYIILYVCNV